MIEDIENMEAGLPFDDPGDLMEELKTLVYMSDHTPEEKEVLYDMFSEALPLNEIKQWRHTLQLRHKDQLTRVHNGELLKQDDLKIAIRQAVERENT